MKRHYTDTDFDRSLEDLDSHFMWKKEQKLELKNRILTDIDRIEIQGEDKNGIDIIRSKKSIFPRKLVYSAVALTLLFSLFIGSAFISPAMAEVISKLPFLGSLNHNVIQLQKNPDQIGAYLDLVSAYNKGDDEAYLDAYSRESLLGSEKELEKDLKTRKTEKHQIAAKLDLVYSNENRTILLSNEKHAFDTEVLYNLVSYIVLTKENGSWKVLDKVPFKKVGTGKNGSHDDFDKTEEVRQELEKTYQITF